MVFISHTSYYTTYAQDSPANQGKTQYRQKKKRNVIEPHQQHIIYFAEEEYSTKSVKVCE
jgi:hypothetical protein